MTTMRRFFSQLIPFFFIGIAIVAFAFSMMLLAYLFFLGAIVGLILFLASYIKQRFFPSKKDTRKTASSSGRVIDSNDWRKM